mgnify:CR=1 FL=1
MNIILFMKYNKFLNFYIELVEKNLAIHFSEYENIISAQFFKKKINLLWITTLAKLKINNLNSISKYKNCLACSEKWSRPKGIKRYINFLPNAVLASIRYS